MLHITVYPEANTAKVNYPKEARLPDRTIPVFTPDKARDKWESETRRYIHDTLRSWILQRNKAYQSHETLTGPRSAAVDKLLLMLSMHQYSRLHVLCRRIYRDSHLFIRLIPSKESRHFLHFRDRIAPILIWTEEYITSN